MAAAVACSAWGAEEVAYPLKPVHLVVPAAPGGGLDVLARVLANRLSAVWQQQAVVDNKPGANFIVGTDAAAKSAPDGATLLFVSSGALTVNPVVYPSLPYEPERDLIPIIIVSANPFDLLVNQSLPVASFPEFLAYLRSHPGQLNHASNSATTILASELLKSLAQVDYVDVNYKGAVLAATSTAAGDTQFCFVDAATAIGALRNGRVRVLAVTSPERYKLQPDIPTIAESGLPGYASTAWIVLLAPAKTPASIVARVNGDVQRALEEPQLREKFEAVGNEVVGGTPQFATATLRADREKWARLVKERNIRLQ